jgi:phage N-6-adenine-methyltransferase
MQGKEVVHSSLYPDYQTPLALFSLLHDEFRFDLDLAANSENALTNQFFGPGSHLSEDALSVVSWRSFGAVGFVNPPYSRRDRLTCEPWVSRAHSESLYGFTTVALLPVRTDTRWWNSYVMQATEIRTIPHRVNFDVPPRVLAEHDAKRVQDGKAPLKKLAGAGFPSAVVIWRPRIGIVHHAGPLLRTWDYRGQ